MFSFEAGVLSQFSKLHIKWTGLTEGASIRVLIPNPDGNGNYQYISSVTNGDVELGINTDFGYQWGGGLLNADQVSRVTQIRIGGADGAVPASMTIDPADIYLETTWETPMSISTASDWKAFANLVNAGLTDLNATLTTDIEVTDGTMIGVGSQDRGSENPKAYSGTFDGQNYTITYNSSKTTEKVTAPFRFVKGGTIKNLKTAGSMSSTQNIMGGIAGFVQGTILIDNCSSSMNLSTDDTENDATIGGILGLQDQDPTTLNVTNCMYTGTITGDHGISGIAGYMRNGGGATFTNILYAGSYATESANPDNMQNIVRGGGTLTNCYYVNKIAGKTDGTEATSAMLASGEVTYILQGSQATQYWGQNLKAASSSPLLTNNPAYKVYSIGNNEYANSINTIGSSEDWILFSKLVAAGQTDLDVTMTADVNAGSTMVGTSSYPYQGTFDGGGHTLTFTYDGTEQFAAPFQFVNAATFSDLRTRGSITTTNNQCGGIIGKNTGGNTTLNRCMSSATIKSTNENNGRAGGLVGRCTDGSMTLNYCMYDGEMICYGTQGASGFVGYFSGTLNINHCLVASTKLTGDDQNFAGGWSAPTATNSYYLQKFGSSSQGTKLDEQLINSGQAAWDLNQGIGDGAWFFGQGKLNASNVEACPTLTTDPSKKVVRTKASGTSTDLYVNPGGAAPNAVRMRATGFSMTDGGEVVTTIPSSFTTDDVLIYRTSASFKFKVSAAGATTLIVPFNVEALPDGMTAYNLDFDGTNVTATPVSSITADKPVLINAPAGEYTFNTGLTGTIEDYASRSTTNGSLTGVYNEAGSSSSSNPLSYVPANAYVLQNGTNGLAFYKVDEANKIKITSFRAYLTAPTNSRSLRIVYNDSSTGIDATLMNNEERIMNNEIYNLSGQRIDGSQLNPGIYIKNGQKVAIK